MKKTLFAILLALFAVSAAWAQTGSLTVTVLDEGTGLPIAGAGVHAILDGHGHERPHYDGPTDENGMISFTDIEVGEYHVNAEAPGYHHADGEVEVLEGATSELSLALRA